MTIIASPATGNPSASLPLRYALRELRGGLRGFYVFIACIALGVMTISGVGSVAASLGENVDPRDLLERVAADAASQETRQTIARAESRQQALALLLMSPEFQRR